jgi:hypothetical protein
MTLDGRANAYYQEQNLQEHSIKNSRNKNIKEEIK